MSADDAGAALARAKAVLAREFLDADTAPATLGDVVLHQHQRRAVARIRVLLEVAGGALLADSTGLGKTFVALAVASGFERVLIAAPASLADAWSAAVERARINARFVSLERLSRGGAAPVENPHLVIVDEAHHLRNPRTKCYAGVAAMCDQARVLLLTATPLQNRREELVAQLALFLGDNAVAATDAELARFIVRRRADTVSLRLPAIRGPNWVRLPVDDDLLDEILSLPAPLPASDEGTAGPLVAYSLLRQWASSRAGLVEALRRRIAKAVAMTTSLESGRWPSRDQLAAWSYAGEAVQLAWPELLTPLGGSSPSVSSMLLAVRDHSSALHALLARLRELPDPDPARADVIRDICRAHRGERVLAFSQYAETIRALSHLLMPIHEGVAALTARGGRVVGGRVSRRELLAQFSPRAGGLETPIAERVDLLLTTDVLSEGLDLQRASVVIHLDLPWNPARLEQRVGRVRRLGSEHDTISVYALAPPASSERMLRVVERLRVKLGLAGQLVGLDSTVIPGAESVHAIAPPELTSDTHSILETWGSVEDSGVPALSTLYAGVASPHDGFLALLGLGRERVLLAALDDPPSLDAGIVGRAVALSGTVAIIPRADEVDRAVTAIRSWCREWTARRSLSLPSSAGARLRLRISARITALVASAPRHERALLAPFASAAHQALRASLGASGERALAALAGAAEVNERWLREIGELAMRHERRAPSTDATPLVVILLCRREPEHARPSAPSA